MGGEDQRTHGEGEEGGGGRKKREGKEGEGGGRKEREEKEGEGGRRKEREEEGRRGREKEREGKLERILSCLYSHCHGYSHWHGLTFSSSFFLLVCFSNSFLTVSACGEGCSKDNDSLPHMYLHLNEPIMQSLYTCFVGEIFVTKAQQISFSRYNELYVVRCVCLCGYNALVVFHTQ